SLNTGNPIPSGITNSYAHALSFIRVLKNNLHNYPSDYKLKILDLGSGSGLFAKYLLKAAYNENILDRIFVILADFSTSALKEIKKLRILRDFEEDKNYKFIQLDIFNYQIALDLFNEAYELGPISACTLNYIYDSMPTIILRPSVNRGFEKLQFRFLEKNIGQDFKQEISDEELKNNLSYLKTLLCDERWIDYRIEEQNELQQKYFYLVENENYTQQFAYSYGSLAITENIYNLLDDYGFIFCAEMKNNPNPLKPFEIYANSAAHFINEPMISKLALNMGATRFYTQDHFLQKIIYFKNQVSVDQEFLKSEFIDSSSTDLLMDLKQILIKLQSPYSKKIAKFAVEEITKLDPYSCFTLYMEAQCARLHGDQDTYFKKLFASTAVDYFNDFETRVYNKENKLENSESKNLYM
ncbi:MAG: hypothetical protein RLZZ361_674, partial [Cyanobacteriota bacterium]